jgi:hypothetical protein
MTSPAAVAGQVVRGTVGPQFGATITPEGTVTAGASTLPVTVTRTVEKGKLVVTIAPRS